MSFSPKTENLTQELINAEYLNAVVNHGEKFNSLHEGYAVLLEEVEEASIEFEVFNYHFHNLWDGIKQNDKQILKRELKDLEAFSICAIKELAQVGAVLQKIKNTLEFCNGCVV